MDELIIRSLRRQAREDEEHAVRRWRTESPENEERYRDLAAVWRFTELAAWPSRSAPPSAAAIMSRAHASPYPGRDRGIAARARWSTRVAAIAALLLLGFVIGFLRSPHAPEAGELKLVTGAGEMSAAHLPDGTVVRLGPESRLRVVGEGAREAWLEGVAFFAVAHAEERPYVVRTRAGEANVLGTRFEINARGDELQLTVIEGRVVVSAGREQVVVNAGEATEVRAGSQPGAIRQANVEASYRWLGSFVAFQSTPLRSVAAELEARFGARIVIADPGLEERTVTAWFTAASLDEMLSVICRVADLRCSRRGNVTVLEP